jgi:hypothetical protein
VRAGQSRFLAHPLRPDHDGLELEAHVREGAQERSVERARAVMALPPLAGDDSYVQSGSGSRPVLQVAPVLGDRGAFQSSRTASYSSG